MLLKLSCCDSAPPQLSASQSDSTYGTTATGRICGALLVGSDTAVNAGSYDPDTAEWDSIKPIEHTSEFYFPIHYAMVRSFIRCTAPFNSGRFQVHGAKAPCLSPAVRRLPAL